MDGKKVNEEVKKVEENYKQWLLVSNISEDDFLNCAKTKDFTFISEKDTKYNVISVGYNSNGKFNRIGEQLVYLEKDVSGFMDLSLLLLFMAQKLDKIAVEFGERRESYYDRARQFIVGLEEFGVIQSNNTYKC